MKKIAYLIILSTFSLACSDATVEKGEEENPLIDGKSDSFYRPTNHGALQFEIENPATIGDEDQFHAWTFELSGEAKITLKTNVSRNLDTVMYLYKRTPGAETWGRYKKKNDDHDGNIWSQITYNGDAGEYRVIVKPFKKALRGSFSVAADCTGDGCIQEVDGTCEDGRYQNLPSTTRYTSGCTDQIMGLLSSKIVSENSGRVLVANHCTVRGLEQIAIEHYASYWLQWGSFEDLFYGDLEEIDFNFNHTTYEKGHLISVDAGGDEDGLSLFYTNEGELLAAYQHNQSPSVEFYCGDDRAEEQEEPSPECFQDIMWNVPSGNAEPAETQSGTEELSTIETVEYYGVSEAVADYRETFDAFLHPSQLVDYTVEEFADVIRVSLYTIDDESIPLWATYTFVTYTRYPRTIKESATSTISCSQD